MVFLSNSGHVFNLDIPVSERRLVPGSRATASAQRVGRGRQKSCVGREMALVSRLESECSEKDDLIHQLRDEVTSLQSFVRHLELERCPACQQLPSVCTSASAAGRVTSPGQVTVIGYIRGVVVRERGGTPFQQISLATGGTLTPKR